MELKKACMVSAYHTSHKFLLLTFLEFSLIILIQVYTFLGVFLFSLVLQYQLELRHCNAEKLILKIMRDEPKGLSLFFA